MRRTTVLSFLLVWVMCCLWAFNVLAAQGHMVHGKVVDAAGQVVQGAEVFIYDSTNTRRPADFITAKTGRDGSYSIQLPPGKYWAVARVRQGEKYGPLLPGARHSGEPVAIDDGVDGTVEQDFVVADIRDVARGQARTSNDVVRVAGRIVDKEGKPVRAAYVVAGKKQDVGSLPQYVSAWSDDSGNYVLYLPAGDYFLGVATDFPPKPSLKLTSQLTVQPAKIDIAFDMIITLE